MPKQPSGIYKITNLKNGKVYIGQSKNIFERKLQHFTALHTHWHENTQMQKDWNKDSHGFRWDVVEYCPLNKLNEREKFWIDKYDSIDKGYNQGWVPYTRKPTKSHNVRHKKTKYHKDTHLIERIMK